jgi:hypothetical protein
VVVVGLYSSYSEFSENRMSTLLLCTASKAFPIWKLGHQAETILGQGDDKIAFDG